MGVPASPTQPLRSALKGSRTSGPEAGMRSVRLDPAKASMASFGGAGVLSKKGTDSWVARGGGSFSKSFVAMMDTGETVAETKAAAADKLAAKRAAIAERKAGQKVSSPKASPTANITNSPQLRSMASMSPANNAALRSAVMRSSAALRSSIMASKSNLSPGLKSSGGMRSMMMSRASMADDEDDDEEEEEEEEEDLDDLLGGKAKHDDDDDESEV